MSLFYKPVPLKFLPSFGGHVSTSFLRREREREKETERVDKIDGVRVDGLSCLKLMVNEMKDSPGSEETADAERQTKDAWCDREAVIGGWHRWPR